MNWFLIALLAPALWSITNHIDKYLVEKYFKGGGTGALIIFSSIIGLFVIPVIPIFRPDVFDVSIVQAALATLSGIIIVIGLLFYLYALKKDEASIVVPLFQFIPVFLFVLGFMFLNEVLTIRQILGSLLIILGGVSLSLDLSAKMPRLKPMILFLMLVASFLIAVHSLIFKIVALETDFWIPVFWTYFGSVLVGFFFLVFIRSYRNEFLRVIKINKIPVIGLNVLNEILATLGDLVFKFATLLAPLALVSSVNGFSPFFVFFFGVILTIFFPRLGTESLLKKDLAQKIITIAIMFIGTYVLTS